MRVRGLKLRSLKDWERAKNVAPHAGAWIETSPYVARVRRHMSHPMRVRGLKQIMLLKDIVGI